MYFFNLKRHNSFQNKNNRKAIHDFAPRPLIFKLQQKVLNFNDICVSLSSPKTDQEMNFWNLENRILRASVFSIVIFELLFDIPLLNNLFNSFNNLFISLTELRNIY